ncbi:MAG: sirohydrochlorin cobaltochelatase [Pseudobutyrivibrio sp.]|nr:sirohydrochlorin cobaltochelatase [Pseudobutyrivibrio sp.]
MKKKLLVLTSALCMMLSACGTAKVDQIEETDSVTTEVVDDQAAADEVAALIDAIYVQDWTEETDAACAAAKAGWDNLTDAQKELVEGEFADPDYFGRDTGDASADDPLNGDEIGDKEILVVSFGTSFNDSRAKDISAVEKAVAEACPDYSVRRAFTSQIIINHIQARDNEKIDNMNQALDRAEANGVKELVILPTHLMHGAEYDELIDAVSARVDKFEVIKVAEPLLGPVGNDASVINEDKIEVAKAITAEAVSQGAFESLDEAADNSTAFVFMGHGTSHTAKVTYSQMQTAIDELGYDNVFIGTVEGEPEETSCENIIKAVQEAGYTKAILRPLMVVAGDHANNDMAGSDDDSWLSMFKAAGFETVDCQIAGLGEIPQVQEMYVDHVKAAIDGEPMALAEEEAAVSLEPGQYQAAFNTDSGMFHVNDADNGMGVLTVAEDGSMEITINLTSKNILNLYLGTAADAEEDEANWLMPEVAEVSYDDGTSEEVNSFTIPVEKLDTEFECALIGTKGKWYDHMVSVASPK